MSDDHDFDAWRREWRASATRDLDIDALLENARRRNRRDKLVTALEVVLGLVTIAVCLATVLMPGLPVMERSLAGGLAALASLFVAWAFRQRRRSWVQRPADAAALLEHERRRLDGQLRYWQASLVGVAALCVVTVLITFKSALMDGEGARSWLLSTILVLGIWLITLIRKRAVARRVTRRKHELDAVDPPSSG